MFLIYCLSCCVENHTLYSNIFLLFGQFLFIWAAPVVLLLNDGQLGTSSASAIPAVSRVHDIYAAGVLRLIGVCLSLAVWLLKPVNVHVHEKINKFRDRYTQLVWLRAALARTWSLAAD